jgi:hypothetical protein
MFAIILLLSLFGITFVGVCGFYFANLLREYFRGETVSMIEKKARSAINAADLGWLAIVSAPLLGLLIGAIVTVTLSVMGVQDDPFLGYARFPLFMLVISSVAGVIAAGAFWTTSAILGKARQWSKKPGRFSDPDFDRPV